MKFIEIVLINNDIHSANVCLLPAPHLSRCTLAVKYDEVPSPVWNAIVRRRIDCTCSETSCGATTCNAALQVCEFEIIAYFVMLVVM